MCPVQKHLDALLLRNSRVNIKSGHRPFVFLEDIEVFCCLLLSEVFIFTRTVWSSLRLRMYMSYKMSIAEKPSVIFVVFSSHPSVLFSVHFVSKPLVPKRISCWTSFGNVKCGQDAGTCWKDWKMIQFVVGVWCFLLQSFGGELL